MPRPSQGSGFRGDPQEEGLDGCSRRSRMSNVAPEELFEILLEPDQVEERPVVFHLDQQIDVAVVPVVAACDRTENAHVPCAVLRGDAEESFFAGSGQSSWLALRCIVAPR